MAFKAECDDGRDSLAYKLKKLLTLSKRVLCSFVPDPALVSLERVLEEADVLFVATPHRRYASLEIPPHKPVFDVWGVIPKSTEI
jgi:UDP-N-acetyl-D-mannosaminuronic acid dehydrogenase